MKIRIFGVRSFVLAVALGVGLGFVFPAFATSVIVNPDGKVTYLGTLGGSSVATDINDAGQVVGYSSTTADSVHAFITGPNGVGMTDLGTLGGLSSFAYDVNTAGQVAGSIFNIGTGSHAFITGPNGMGMSILDALDETLSIAAINDHGQIVGHYGTEGGLQHGFITGPNGAGMTDLGTLGGNYSYAMAINNAGQVAGSSETGGDISEEEENAIHAFITGPNGAGMTDLGTLGGNYSLAYGINDAGQVVGVSRTGDGSYHAFITGPNGAGMTDLGTLGGDGSFARDINTAGQVVGSFYFYNTEDGLQHAFITGPNGEGMIDINSYAHLPEGFYLSFASDINNVGQVIATISPIPEPASYALMLAGLGLVGFMARRKKPAGNTVEGC